VSIPDSNCILSSTVTLRPVRLSFTINSQCPNNSTCSKRRAMKRVARLGFTINSQCPRNSKFSKRWSMKRVAAGRATRVKFLCQLQCRYSIFLIALLSHAFSFLIKFEDNFWQTVVAMFVWKSLLACFKLTWWMDIKRYDDGSVEITNMLWWN